MKAAALLSVVGHVSAAQYWWKFAGSDCGYDDVAGSCEGQTVDGCKATCLQTPGCDGFNYPHGILKKTDCLSHKTASSVDLYVLQDAPMPPKLWPLPQKVAVRGDAVKVTPSAGFFTAPGSPSKGIVDQAFSRYQGLVFPHNVDAGSGGVTGLMVSVADWDESYPQLETDESYALTVNSSGPAVLSAKTVYGALRGLETFSQLVGFNFDSQTYTTTPVAIEDAPRFPHRGLMVDTARHFQPLAAIRAIIDSLPYAKLNVLHWHMSDTQSFPFESKTYPKLWEGSYSPQERYLQADIADVVEYARLRGVRVMVEFDMPGHAGSFCAGYPEVCPSPTCTQPLNVANDATFDLLKSLINESTGGRASKKGDPSPGLFKDNFVHLGGDEVNTACWTETPSVAKWLAARNMSADDGYAYFVKRVAQMAIDQGHRPVQWSEVYDHFKNKLAKETVVHIWKGVTNVTEVLAGGYNVLLNVGYNSVSWYLDNLDINWAAAYKNEPCNGVPDNLCPLILGGHGEMWGETVDASDLEQTVWPKLGSIAEKLWSPRDQTKDAAANFAQERLEAFRCELNRRGVRAAPVNNANARSAPPGPGSCFAQ
eukprot:TRINITY_DN12964_c0_g1_i1.p1 TRINITY_DN12964_c0_g1~~TRINITY_DN12964_c0_g1_i1.p1  ORF type:complete len:595 (+),score=148.63 TRINITY_DN12964_c0_g1_i1:52-1836(+)